MRLFTVRLDMPWRNHVTGRISHLCRNEDESYDQVGDRQMQHHQFDSGLSMAIPDKREEYGNVADGCPDKQHAVHDDAH